MANETKTGGSKPATRTPPLAASPAATPRSARVATAATQVPALASKPAKSESAKAAGASPAAKPAAAVIKPQPVTPALSTPTTVIVQPVEAIEPVVTPALSTSTAIIAQPVAPVEPAPVAAAPVSTPADSQPAQLAAVHSVSALFNFPLLQETFAMENPTFDFASAFKTAFSDAQEKAKAAYEKGTAAMGDANEFAKGNVEALVESSKILATGLQELTTELVAETREAFESLTAEVKTLAGVKSPVDFFKLQSEMMRKQMDAMMANGTKHSEAMLKLASDAVAPISGRVSLAVEKVKTAA